MARQATAMKKQRARYSDAYREEALARAKAKKLRVRGYVTWVLGCLYESETSPAKVAEVAKALYEVGCYEGVAMASCHPCPSPSVQLSGNSA